MHRPKDYSKLLLKQVLFCGGQLDYGSQRCVRSKIRVFFINKVEVEFAYKPSGPSGQHFSPVSVV